MKFKLVCFAIVLMVVVLGMPSQLSAQVQTVTCSSDDMGRHTCPANTLGGVRLSRQISGSPCTQGVTWGFDNNGIWVDKGCRAEFEVSAAAATTTAGAQSQTVTCASDDMKRHSCPADVRGGARLSRQISGSPCTQGATWGYDSNGIWVDKGCRAEFQVGSTAGVMAGTVPVGQGTVPVGQTTNPCGSGLVGQLSQGLNITPEQARGGAGALFALAQSRLSAQDFNQVSTAVPEMNGLLQAAPAPGQLSAFGGWTSVVGVFQKLGLTPDMVVKFVPVLVNYVKCRGGSSTASLLGRALQ